jgi:hypothetical protein
VPPLLAEALGLALSAFIIERLRELGSGVSANEPPQLEDKMP